MHKQHNTLLSLTNIQRNFDFKKGDKSILALLTFFNNWGMHCNRLHILRTSLLLFNLEILKILKNIAPFRNLKIEF